jgi:hypothetical protein
LRSRGRRAPRSGRRRLEERRAEDERRRAAEWAEEKRRFNLERGEIANKFGTLAHDIVAPSVPRVVASVFGVPVESIEHFGVRLRRRLNGRSREFDTVAAWPGWWMVVETKTTLAASDVRRLETSLPTARAFFPEYAGRKLAGAVASLYLDASVVRHAERHGLIVMGLGDDLMEAKNLKGFRPREF